MKRLILCAVALSLAATTFGQIKMVDSSFETYTETLKINTDTISVMEQQVSLDQILLPYDKKINSIKQGEKGISNVIGEKIFLFGDQSAFSKIWDEQEKKEKKSVNEYIERQYRYILNEQMKRETRARMKGYVSEELKKIERELMTCVVLKIDRNQQCVEWIDELPRNQYYTFVGILLSKEELKSLYDEVSNFTNIAPYEDYDCFVTHLAGKFSKDPKYQPYSSEHPAFVSSRLRSLKELQLEYGDKWVTALSNSITRWPSPRTNDIMGLFYKLMDDAGYEYIIYAECAKDEEKFAPYMMVSYFESIVDELNGQKVAIICRDPQNVKLFDVYTNTPLANVKIAKNDMNNLSSNQDNYFAYTCTDILLRDDQGHIMAVLSDGESKFTLDIERKPDGNYQIVPNAMQPILLSKNKFDEILRKRKEEAERERLNNLANQQREAELEKQRKLREAELKRKRQLEEERRRQSLIDRYGAEYGKLIFERKVAIGMSAKMCREAWGTPSNITTTITANSKNEVWFYYNNKLVLHNDKLIKIVTNY